ncbi:MAG: hypothetical protein U5R49_08645 [Deltaproteobacteria bacterium]|nr:hypothetical protein [Deltaproteobacteria bacterium]
MEDHYFEISTLYVFGRVIAYARILMIEGVYSDLVTFDEQFGKAIKEKLKDLERLMKGFHKYDRFALADALIECEKGYSKVCSYLAFKQHYEQDLLRSNNLLPAREFLSTLSGQMVKNALRIIEEMLEQIKKQTKIPTTVQQSTK